MTNEWRHELDKLALRAIAKASKKNSLVTCRSGTSPSGVKHIGNFNDNMLSYFIYLIVRKKNVPARHVHTHDNMDPFRKLPERVIDLDGKWYETSSKDRELFNKYVGMPLCRVPDLFGCCKNWADHFQRIYENECKMMGLIDTKYFSTEKLYESGHFNQYIKKMLEHIEVSREIILSVEKSKPSDYVPAWAICENCGKITGRIIRFDIEDETAEYVCRDRYLTTKYKAIGCGYKGTVSWRNGGIKLDWEFEWPAQMLMFNTTIEPFGKDHVPTSWFYCKEVIKKVYGGEVPIGFFYEHFHIKGKKMSSRHGNVVTITQMLEILEPEVIRFLYTGRFRRHRDIDLGYIFRLADEFDRAEKIYFGLKRGRNKKEEMKLRRRYELAMLNNPPPEYEPRISYRVAAQIAQIYPEKAWLTVVRRITGRNSMKALRRISLAKNWVIKYMPDDFRISIVQDISYIKEKLTRKEQNILRDLAKSICNLKTEDDVWCEMRRVSERHEVTLDKIFKLLYKVLLGKEYGPRLPALLLVLDRNFLVRRLNLEA
ncbi:MAG: lysine--tRNA ligase [Thermoprotei archaeon]|nr:MAG: lysine--tRNA ligase [Thermoprotei archaeon]